MSNQITGGVFFNAVVMGRDIQVVLPAEIKPALTGLPRAAAVFTGRDVPAKALLEALRPDRSPGTRLVSAVAGMPGVGKTALVLHAAHQALREEGWFPGGVLFVDMFGYDPDRRLSAADALLGWLAAVGIPGDHIPATEQDRSRLWRSVLDAYSAQDRRLLLIIDNAATEDQVLPLLPGDDRISVLVTSRHTLDLDARLHDLDILGQHASVTLIREVIAHRRGADDPRLRDPGADGIAELAGLCAGLPLALRIVAALLADRPRLQPEALAVRLRDEQARLDGLSREQVAVRAAFDLSYRYLTRAKARLFRLLPINPGPDIATDSAVALAGLTHDQTVVLLEGLHRAHLIGEPVPDRWRMHDLIRLYAAEQPPAVDDEIDAARRRLFGYYQHKARAADTHLRMTVRSDTSVFPDQALALGWLDAEHGNLIAVCTAAPALGLPETTLDLAFALSEFLSLRRHFTESITVLTQARDVYQQTGVLPGEGRACNNLGHVLRQVRRFDEAIAAHTRHREISHHLGDLAGEGTAWNSLGLTFREARRFDEAIAAHTRARDIFRRTGDQDGESRAWGSLGLTFREARRFDEAIAAHTEERKICQRTDAQHGEGTAWNNLGRALSAVRRFDEAIAAHTRAREIYRRTGDQDGESLAWGHLGYVLRQVRRLDDAIAAHTQEREIARQVRDLHREGQAWGNLGFALTDARRFEEAVTAHTRHVEICHETGDAHGEATAWNCLGFSLTEVRRFDEAITAYTRAREIYQRTGDPHGVGTAWGSLGLTFEDARRFDEAIAAHTRAREIYEQTNDLHGQGVAWNNLGLALREVRRFDEAIAAHTRAREVYERTDDLHGQGTAWNNLGLALREVRRFDEAIAAHTRAHEIYKRTGDPHREGRAWGNLGLALADAGRRDAAIAAHTRQLEICRQLGDLLGEGTAWGHLGIELQKMSRFDEAIGAQVRARDICRQTGDPQGEGRALANLGYAQTEAGRFEDARISIERAVVAFTMAGDTATAAQVRGWLDELSQAQANPERRSPS